MIYLLHKYDSSFPPVMGEEKNTIENTKGMLEKCRENFPPVLGGAKREANSLGAVSTSALDQHNQWTSDISLFFFSDYFRQIHLTIFANIFSNLDVYIDQVWLNCRLHISLGPAQSVDQRHFIVFLVF